MASKAITLIMPNGFSNSECFIFRYLGRNLPRVRVWVNSVPSIMKDVDFFVIGFSITKDNRRYA